MTVLVRLDLWPALPWRGLPVRQGFPSWEQTVRFHRGAAVARLTRALVRRAPPLSPGLPVRLPGLRWLVSRRIVLRHRRSFQQVVPLALPVLFRCFVAATW